MEHQNQQTGLYSKDVIINLRSSEARHLMLLREALRSFDEKDTYLKLCASGGQNFNTPRYFKLFSHFLSDIIDSCPLVQEMPTIILPDCPVNSIKHLVNLLTEGFTRSGEDDHEVKDIMEVANILKIDLKNLVYDERTKQAEPMKDDELEEGEIEDDEEDFLLLEQEQTFGNKVGIKIASFAKVNSSNPNIMTSDKINNNITFPCRECKKTFGTAAGVEDHLKMSSKHNFFQCPECHNFFTSEVAFENHLTTSKHGSENINLHLAQEQQPKVVKKRGIQKASLAKVDASNPSIMICNVCGKGFQGLKRLVGHLRIAHPHKCNLCDYVGPKLKKHMKKQHGGYPSEIL